MEEKEKSQAQHPEAWAEHLEKRTVPSRSCLREHRRGSVPDVFGVRKLLVLLLLPIPRTELHFTQWTKGPHMLLLLHKVHFRPLCPPAASSPARPSARQGTLPSCPQPVKGTASGSTLLIPHCAHLIVYYVLSVQVSLP